MSAVHARMLGLSAIMLVVLAATANKAEADGYSRYVHVGGNRISVHASDVSVLVALPNRLPRQVDVRYAAPEQSQCRPQRTITTHQRVQYRYVEHYSVRY